MTRFSRRPMFIGVACMAASMLLIELLGFRLAAAVYGAPVAVFGAMLLPVAAGFGGIFSSRMLRQASRAKLVARAAHLCGLAGAAMVLGLIALTWSSQRLARAKGVVTWLDVAVYGTGWWLPGLLCGMAIGMLLRSLWSVLGRAYFAAAAAAAITAVLTPWWMQTLGAPRLMLAVAALPALASLLLARSVSQAAPATKVHWPQLATLPLVLIALLAGDVGKPWLKVRTDVGRRSDIEHNLWTPAGLVAVDKVRRGRSHLTVDKGYDLEFAEAKKLKQKPKFRKQDLIYSIKIDEDANALVVGATAGREIGVALAYGHRHVDAIVHDGATLNEVVLGAYSKLSDHLLLDRDKVHFVVGEPRQALAQLSGDYQHIVVMGDGQYVQAAPRLLPRSDADFSQQAISAYLSRLTPQGRLLMHIPHAAIGTTLRSAQAALGRAGAATPKDHLITCSASGGRYSVVLVGASPLSPRDSRTLQRQCRTHRLTIAYPPTNVRRLGSERPLDRLRKPKNPGRQRADLRPAPNDEATRKANALLVGAALDDAAPYFDATPTLAMLPTAMRQALLGLAQAAPEAEGSKPKPKTERPAAASLFATTMAAGGIGVTLLLLLLALGPARGTGRGAARLGTALRLSSGLFGLALALEMFGLSHQLLLRVGSMAYAWALIIPLGMVGIACGRLWADLPTPGGARRSSVVAIGVAIVWLVALDAVFHLELLRGIRGLPLLAIAAVLLLLTGALLGLPLAALGKLQGEDGAAAVSWTWGAHLAGWGVGGAAAVMGLRYLGPSKLSALGLACFAAAAVLFALGSRTRSSLRSS